MIGQENDACPKYMTLINIGYLSSRTQQFKLRGIFKMADFHDVNVDVAQKLPKLSYAKFISLSLKFAQRKSNENHNIYYINRPAFK